jgi:hypothetical protein
MNMVYQSTNFLRHTAAMPAGLRKVFGLIVEILFEFTEENQQLKPDLTNGLKIKLKKCLRFLEIGVMEASCKYEHA